MEIRRDVQGDIIVLSLAGRLMGGEGAEQFEQEVQSVLDAGHRKIVMDLGDVPWADSIGLGTLIAARNAIAEIGGELKLCSLSEQIDSTFMITGLNRIFESHATPSEALASFATDASGGNPTSTGAHST